MTYPAAGRFGKARPPVAPVANTPAANATAAEDGTSTEWEDTPGADEQTDQTVEDATDTAEEDTDEAAETPATADADAEETASADTAAPANADKGGQPAAADSADADTMAESGTAERAAPERSRSQRGRRTGTKKPKAKAATKGTQTLVVIEDGHVTVSDPDSVVIDLDNASGAAVTAHEIVDLLAELKSAESTPLRTDTIDSLTTLITEKALSA